MQQTHAKKGLPDVGLLYHACIPALPALVHISARMGAPNAKNDARGQRRPWLGDLHHSGLLLDGTRLAALGSEWPLAPLDPYVERELRRRAAAPLNDPAGEANRAAAWRCGW